MSNLNPQQEIRASLCQQYLHTGRYEASQIIANVQALVNFIFEGAQTLPDVGEKAASITKTAEPEQTAVTENKAEAAKVEKVEEVKAVQESEQTESIEPKYNSNDVRAALLSLGKAKGKDAIMEVLTAVGATSVPTINESDYVKVMSLTEEKMV